MLVMLKMEDKNAGVSSQESENKVNQDSRKQSTSKKSHSTQDHSFLMDQSYMQQMQDGLLELLDDFKQGKKNGFGKKVEGLFEENLTDNTNIWKDNNESLTKMNDIKKMQENLAQLHFQLENEDNEKRTALSEDERTKRSQEKIDRLMKNMETLCSAVQNLHQYQDGDS